VNLAANPVNGLESHSCTSRRSNSPRITLLRKNRGRGCPPATLGSRLGSISRLLDTSLFDDLRLGDWIHHRSRRMQQSRPASRPGLPTISTYICHPERSEGSAFLFHIATSIPDPHQSAVDTAHRLPYSAPANEFASPSPPSSSRHSAALDDVCIAIRYHTVLITRWRNGPAGFLFLDPTFLPPQNSGEGKRQRSKCNSTSPKQTD
jgi:hypothetical protein